MSPQEITGDYHNGLLEIESAIKSMKMDAYDYITKSFQMDEIILTLRKDLENCLKERGHSVKKRSRIPI